MGCTAEHTSCVKPGSVNSHERVPPPIFSCASRTRTVRPARARTIAAAKPFGPEPMTTPSYSFLRFKASSNPTTGRGVRVSRGYCGVVIRYTDAPSGYEWVLVLWPPKRKGRIPNANKIHFVIPSEARNLSKFLRPPKKKERFLASLGMTWQQGDGLRGMDGVFPAFHP
jgi:hypothetical protein